MSSAYRSNLFSCWPIDTPLIPLFDWILAANISIKMRNNRGLSEHPCRAARDKQKNWEIIPLEITAAFGSLYSILTHLIKCDPKPNRDKARKRKLNFQLYRTPSPHLRRRLLLVHHWIDSTTLNAIMFEYGQRKTEFS